MYTYIYKILSGNFKYNRGSQIKQIKTPKVENTSNRKNWDISK